MIPKVIHRIWIGTAEPPQLEAVTRSWRTHFPDYRLEWWTGERLADLGMPVHWHRAHTYAEKADIARYRLLHRFGGIYADCDVQPLQRFDHLWEDTDSLVAFQESSDLVWNGLIIASVGAPVLALSSRLADRSARRHAPTAAPNVRTGPFVFTAAIDYQRFIDPRGIRVYPPGFAHVRGEQPAHAVVSSPFRDPPEWALATDDRSEAPEAGGWTATVADADLGLRLLPVRVRRVLRSHALRPPGRRGSP